MIRTNGRSYERERDRGGRDRRDRDRDKDGYHGDRHHKDEYQRDRYRREFDIPGNDRKNRPYGEGDRDRDRDRDHRYKDEVALLSKLDRGRFSRSPPCDREVRRQAYDAQELRQPRLSLRQAIDELSEATTTALSSLSRLKDDFRREARGIQAYADDRILTHLWTSKLRLSTSKTPKTKVQRESNRKDEGRSVAGFDDMADTLVKSLRVASVATRSGPDRSISKKLQTVGRDVEPLLDEVPKSYGAVDQLLTELEMLRVFLERNGAKKLK